MTDWKDGEKSEDIAKKRRKVEGLRLKQGEVAELKR